MTFHLPLSLWFPQLYLCEGQTSRWNLEFCHTLQVSPYLMNESSELGTCPFCGSPIRTDAILVEYEVNGETRFFAECDSCDEPVQPE
jgi:hypothetical protein